MGRSANKPGAAPETKMDRGRRARVFRRMLKYLLRYKWLVLLAFFMMLASNALALVGPRLSGMAIDAINLKTGVDFDSVFLYSAGMVAVYLVSALLGYLTAALMVLISQKVVYTMRRDVFNHLMTLPVNYIDAHATGNIVSHLSYDIDTINASLSHDVVQVCASAVTVVGSLVMMLIIKPVLLCVFLITVPISLLFTRYKTKKIRPLFKARSARLGELNGFAEEMLSGQKTIRAYAREESVVAQFDCHNDEAVEAYYRADYQGAMIGPTVNFINNLSIALITTLGGIFYMLTLSMGDALSPVFCIELGAVSSFIQYSRKFSGPINEFANILNELQSAMAAAERVFTLLDEPSEVPDTIDATELKDADGEVTLDHVRFEYTSDREIIHDLSLHAPRGSLIAIVGPTGAGKTTIINLLMRFYDVDGGEIRLDDMPIPSLTRDSLRGAYTMVLQDTWLFEGTIYENIAYGKPDATREEVEAAARAAHIDTFIRSLPNGYDTVLSDDGVNLSKGQKQLITIARAMLPKTSMLIIDEATSNVDSRTEKKIQEAMLSLMEDRTSFVIAHRLSTIQNADRILVMRDGNVVEQGTHEELLRMDGFYSSLYHAQFR
ncbi:MAG: ABC transporter ATP-binding protein [Clostridia bacterium]|nr:ABC transporter ATP-binding protein [Clostridia bacterium]